jgi:hypothetical protein
LSLPSLYLSIANNLFRISVVVYRGNDDRLSIFSLYLLILNDLFCLSVFLTAASTRNWQRRLKIPIVPGAPHGVKNTLFIPSTGFHPMQLRCRIGDRPSATLSSMAQTIMGAMCQWRDHPVCVDPPHIQIARPWATIPRALSRPS